jgi:hypothetical protein
LPGKAIGIGLRTALLCRYEPCGVYPLSDAERGTRPGGTRGVRPHLRRFAAICCLVAIRELLCKRGAPPVKEGEGGRGIAGEIGIEYICIP